MCEQLLYSFPFLSTFRHKTTLNQKFAEAYWKSNDSLLVKRPLPAAFHGRDSEDHDSSNEGNCTLLSLNWSNEFMDLTKSQEAEC